jgi:hypothetical protein
MFRMLNIKKNSVFIPQSLCALKKHSSVPFLFVDFFVANLNIERTFLETRFRRDLV